MMSQVLPLLYLGNIDYFCILCSNSSLLLEASESFPKQTCRNRCTILSANGPLDLVVPIRHTRERLITRTEPDYSIAWQKQHWQALVSAYKKSPFFDYYADELQYHYRQRYTYLFDLNLALLQLAARWLGLQVRFDLTTTFSELVENDLRLAFKPSKYQQMYTINPYIQVFSEKFGFVPNLSIVDLVFNEGPQAANVLAACRSLH